MLPCSNVLFSAMFSSVPAYVSYGKAFAITNLVHDLQYPERLSRNENTSYQLLKLALNAATDRHCKQRTGQARFLTRHWQLQRLRLFLGRIKEKDKRFRCHSWTTTTKTTTKTNDDVEIISGITYLTILSMTSMVRFPVHLSRQKRNISVDAKLLKYAKQFYLLFFL